MSDPSRSSQFRKVTGHERDPVELAFKPDQRVGAGRFRLEKKVGHGGMGTVWQAFDERLHEAVALKFIADRIRDNPLALQEMRRETSRCHALSHRNIVRIHDLFEPEGEAPFFTMEFVAGKDLHQIAREREKRAFAWKEVSGWLRQICDALSYAHSRGVIHRDLKPANLMLDEAGELKLADFGLAAALRDPAEAQDQGVSGTPAYMSPQQFAGASAAVTDDIYSLGACLFELLAGVRVFEGPDFRRQIEFEPAPLLSATLAKKGLPNEAPEAFEDLIQRCLSKNPQNRPQSAEEFLRLATETFADAQPETVKAKRWNPKFALATATILAAACWIMALNVFGKATRAPLLNLKSAPVQASSFVPPARPEAAFDRLHKTRDLAGTRWASEGIVGDVSEWIAVDLGRDMRIDSIVIDWELAYAKDFTIRTRTSAEGFVDDPKQWTERGRIAGLVEEEPYAINDAKHQEDVEFDFAGKKARVAPWLHASVAEIYKQRPVARHVMINPTARGANNAGVYSIYEVEIRAKPAP